MSLTVQQIAIVLDIRTTRPHQQSTTKGGKNIYTSAKSYFDPLKQDVDTSFALKPKITEYIGGLTGKELRLLRQAFVNLQSSRERLRRSRRLQ